MAWLIAWMKTKNHPVCSWLASQLGRACMHKPTKADFSWWKWRRQLTQSFSDFRELWDCLLTCSLVCLPVFSIENEKEKSREPMNNQKYATIDWARSPRARKFNSTPDYRNSVIFFNKCIMSIFLSKPTFFRAGEIIDLIFTFLVPRHKYTFIWMCRNRGPS